MKKSYQEKSSLMKLVMKVLRKNIKEKGKNEIINYRNLNKNVKIFIIKE